MRLFLGLLLTSLIVACDSSPEECGCNDIIGKRWNYGNVIWVEYDDCNFFEDFKMKSDGSIDVYRYSIYGENVEIVNAGYWELTDDPNCIFSITKGNNYSITSDTLPCYELMGFTILPNRNDSIRELDLNLYSCNSIGYGFISLTTVGR